MLRLLVSVRSVVEAQVSLHNGADMIDIKEPSRGSMGMSAQEAIRAIAREVPPRFPVSAALGEWTDWRGGYTLGAYTLGAQRFPVVPSGLSYLKIGLAGAGHIESWREEFGRFCRETRALAENYSEPALVAVAYADWKAARAPSPDEVLDFAVANGFPVFLLDTWRKDGLSLFDHLGEEAVLRLAESARLRGLEVALAGSLKLRDMGIVLGIAPDVVAVRTAACVGGRREAAIDGVAVRTIAGAIAGARSESLVG